LHKKIIHLKKGTMRHLLRKIGPSTKSADHDRHYIAAAGALAGIALIVVLNLSAGGLAGSIPLIAPMGASAVIVFCLPNSVLGQPWNVVVGNLVSALVGVCCAKWIEAPEMAAVAGMFLSVLGMVVTRSLHPPGGAVALTAILSGPPIKQLGFSFAVSPVLVSSIALVGLGVAFHSVTNWIVSKRSKS
jgi:CBS domain-containing membrane protein